MLVLVLERKVEGLRGEVPDDVGEVTTPKAEEALLFGDADEAVYHTYDGTHKMIMQQPMTSQIPEPTGAE